MTYFKKDNMIRKRIGRVIGREDNYGRTVKGRRERSVKEEYVNGVRVTIVTSLDFVRVFKIINIISL